MQRDLPAQLTVLGTYLGTRGTNLMQQVLPNTYPAGAENPCPTCPTGFRYLTSNGRSMRHSAQIQIRRRLSAGFTAATEYTLAKSMDDAASFAGATLDGGALAQNWRDPGAEYARSSFDQRHLLTASVDYTTGSGHCRRHAARRMEGTSAEGLDPDRSLQHRKRSSGDARVFRGGGRNGRHRIAPA